MSLLINVCRMVCMLCSIVTDERTTEHIIKNDKLLKVKIVILQ